MLISKIKDFPDYEISDSGIVFSYKNKKYMKTIRLNLQKNGYFTVCLWKNGAFSRKLVHRLVAEAFIKNTENKDFVNHKNGIKIDNRVENLEWVTKSENELHRHRVLGQKSGMYNKLGKLCPRSKKIIQIKDGKIINTFYGCCEAFRKTGIRHINECCNKKLKTAGGFIWRYKDEMHDKEL